MSTQTTAPFRQVLKEYRLAAGLTQEALAERAGVSARNIQNLERGENKPLKDLSHPVRAWLVRSSLDEPAPVEVVAAEAANVASVASAPAPRHNLPAALSSFIGREGARAKVRELLTASHLVTLVGTGGVGKTRPALAVTGGWSTPIPMGSGWWSWLR